MDDDAARDVSSTAGRLKIHLDYPISGRNIAEIRTTEMAEADKISFQEMATR